MFCLQAPDLPVVPIAEGVLHRFQARHCGGREGEALRVGFGRVAQAFDQQPQTVAIVAGISQRPAQLPLLALQRKRCGQACNSEGKLMSSGLASSWRQRA